MAAVRADECAALVAEEFTFKSVRRVSEAFAQVCATHHDERAFFAGGKFCDGVGGEFFARAVVAVDKHLCVVLGALLNLLVDFAHFAAVADHFARLLVDDVAERLDFGLESLYFVGFCHIALHFCNNIH